MGRGGSDLDIDGGGELDLSLIQALLKLRALGLRRLEAPLEMRELGVICQSGMRGIRVTGSLISEVVEFRGVAVASASQLLVPLVCHVHVVAGRAEFHSQLAGSVGGLVTDENSDICFRLHPSEARMQVSVFGG